MRRSPPHDVPRLLAEAEELIETGPTTLNADEFAKLCAIVDMLHEVKRELSKNVLSMKRVRKLVGETAVRVTFAGAENDGGNESS